MLEKDYLAGYNGSKDWLRCALILAPCILFILGAVTFAICVR